MNTDVTLSSFSQTGDAASGINGTGDLTLQSGTSTSSGDIAGSGTLTVTPGAVLNWTVGEMSGTGTTVISSGATLAVRADTSLLGQRAPTNHGTPGDQRRRPGRRGHRHPAAGQCMGG